MITIQRVSGFTWHRITPPISPREQVKCDELGRGAAASRSRLCYVCCCGLMSYFKIIAVIAVFTHWWRPYCLRHGSALDFVICRWMVDVFWRVIAGFFLRLFSPQTLVFLKEPVARIQRPFSPETLVFFSTPSLFISQGEYHEKQLCLPRHRCTSSHDCAKTWSLPSHNLINRFLCPNIDEINFQRIH